MELLSSLLDNAKQTILQSDRAIYIAINSIWEVLLLVNICIVRFFNDIHLDIKYYLSVVLICILLIDN